MLSTFVKMLLSLRYQVALDGLDTLNANEGVLILPNHPAEIDPVIVTTYLWDLLHPRPVVLESMYKLPLLHPIMKRIRAIPMADMEFDSGPYKRRRIERALEQITTALRQGDNILIYPSGRLSVTGQERIGGASGVATILQSVPNANIVIVKVRGLYGSIFSKAVTGGSTPDVLRTCLRGLQILAQNLLFFTPRRKVSIQISCNPTDFPRTSDPLVINRHLERIYNSPEPEQPTLVSHSAWIQKVPVLPERKDHSTSLDTIPSGIRDKVIAHIASVAGVSPESITMDTQLGEELGLDSLTMAELLLWLDREFEAHDIELSELITVGSILRAATGQLSSSLPKPEFVVPKLWTIKRSDRPIPEVQAARNIAEAFLVACARFGSHAAVGDERSGVVTWARLKLNVITLARYIATMDGDHVGVLLPASVAASTVTMAAILAGKIPVFLNWTAGKRSLLYACEITKLKAILTSESFLDIIPTDLEFLENRFVLLEDVKANLSVKEKLASKRLSQESPLQILEAFGQYNVNIERTAVVLFTSGSEALPKGVPLSHKNILANVKGVLEAFQINQDDVLLGFLPPFHSFGLTICSLLPLMTGLRVAYHPNPNESRKIAKAMGKWEATVAAGTPTFLRAILKAGDPSLFQTVRALVSGAERAPDELFSVATSVNPAIEVLEGYGITECSPVVSVARPHEPRIGVGRPLQGVSIAVVHPETFTSLPEGEQGLILIRGDNVFSGYLDLSINPFITYRNQQWYNSGDLGRLDKGCLIISGRVKRFIKIAGEMISLAAIEDALEKKLPPSDNGSSVAILSQGTEGDGRPKLIAFISKDLTLEAANGYLRESGFPHIVHISEVRRVRDLPVLGSGKTDYQSLKALLDNNIN